MQASCSLSGNSALPEAVCCAWHAVKDLQSTGGMTAQPSNSVRGPANHCHQDMPLTANGRLHCRHAALRYCLTSMGCMRHLTTYLQAAHTTAATSVWCSRFRSSRPALAPQNRRKAPQPTEADNPRQFASTCCPSCPSLSREVHHITLLVHIAQCPLAGSRRLGRVFGANEQRPLAARGWRPLQRLRGRLLARLLCHVNVVVVRRLPNAAMQLVVCTRKGQGLVLLSGGGSGRVAGRRWLRRPCPAPTHAYRRLTRNLGASGGGAACPSSFFWCVLACCRPLQVPSLSDRGIGAVTV